MQLTPRQFSPVVIVALLFVALPSARADDTPRTGIIDEAGVVDAATESKLNAWLLELEQKTGSQLKVWTMQSTGGRDLYTLTIDTARKWRLGAKGKNNGCLITVAVQDRKWRVVTGEGVEDVLPDLLTDRITQTYFVPNFRKGDYSQGVMLGTVAMAQAIAGKYNVQLSGAPHVSIPTGKGRRKEGGALGACFTMFIVFVILAGIVGGSITRRRRQHYNRWGGGLGDALIVATMIGSMSRGSSGGGSSWGGGGGGFGGGGGGSFGGGGSGGSW